MVRTMFSLFVFRFSRRRLESVCVCVLSIFSRLARGGLRFSDFRLTFAPFSSIFRLSLYTHVRTSSSWYRRCVCSIVSQGARSRPVHPRQPARATFEFQFCE